MGRASAEDIQALIGSTDVAIGWHLQHNHVPAIPTFWNPVALEAVKACNDDDPDREIALPNGLEYRDGRTAIEAWRIVESFRLNEFVYYKEEC